MTDKSISPQDELLADIKQDNASDPWAVADKKGVQLDTPMDNKTIKNAITKRIPEVRRIQLIGLGDQGDMSILCVCELLHEMAILIETDASIFMRHTQLMNIVDNLAEEIKKRKKLIKTNKLPHDFFRSNHAIDLRNFAK